MLDIKKEVCDNREVAYKIFGKGKVNILIEMGLGAVMGEWWRVAQVLSSHGTVLLYERSGYGSSTKADTARTPKNISDELMELLNKIPHEDKIILIGHSQGGLYAQQFARKNPDMVRGLVLLDPLTANDNEFKTQLTKEEYQKSGVDKFSSLSLPRTLVRMHLGFVIQAFMKSAPPFYYYDFPRDEKKYILNALVKLDYYDTVMAEYEQAHRDECIASLRSSHQFPNIPIILITHSSERAIKETMEFGGASLELATKVEKIWQGIMKQYLAFSSNTQYMQAEKSTHYIHLSQPELIVKAVNMLSQEKII